MGKLIAQMAMLGTMILSFTACQSFKAAQIQHMQESVNMHGNAQIHCAGTEDCHFERLDQMLIMKDESNDVERDAVKSGLLRMKAKSLNDPNPVYLSVAPGQHEVVIRFYPVSPDKAERLHVIHAFNPKHTYTFKMFRDRSKHNDSLLDASVPDPLCVDLEVEQKTIRRFCKPYNVLTGLGEFAEKKL